MKLYSLFRLTHSWVPILCCLAFCPGCEKTAPVPVNETKSATEKTSPTTQKTLPGDNVPAPFWFSEIAQKAGIDFTYYGNPSPQHYMVEQNGGGVALFDFDGDHQLDIFLANGSHFDQPAEEAGMFHQLYRGSIQEHGELNYQNATAPAGLKKSGFGMGVACGDYNNDGFVDLYLCMYGKNYFWENNGDGTFSDITTTTSTGDDLWGASAAFGDLDGDGDLDLYVTNYVEYSSKEPPCHTTIESKRVKISCGPIGRIAQNDLLYENQGNGRFVESSEATGIKQQTAGKGLAVQIVDLNHDGLLDLFVANDTTDNFLFINKGNFTFEEQALILGVAVGDHGEPQSSMGIACADYNRNGLLDIFVTNFENAANDFYEQLELGGFLTTNSQLGLDTMSRPMLAFGTVFADFNLDQWPDLFVANGHIWDLSTLGTEHKYEMPQQLFYNQQGKRFQDVSKKSGLYFQDKFLGRATAVGDIDNDGDADLLASHEIKPVGLLRNDSPHKGKSVRLKMIGVRAAREPLGCSIKVTTGEIEQILIIPAGGSFQSSSDPRVLIPVGTATLIDSLIMTWPDGTKEEWRQLPVQKEIVLLQGTGK
ncbi:CRTAC1 family protein [uncultured Gimesia sp.]|uniref:CRTAC1 family protein n=1 Tax=uncultured Gimesia sp. TaxID=1678688 RepID=UPI002639CC02|nr:CRTAC1 family protein [uncultured Gimesia sp.]